MIPVTKPFLPPESEYQAIVHGIWDRNWLTNNGPLVNELELKIKEKLSANHLLTMGNGTLALQVAIKALGLKGEIITTPFSYIATVSSIVWESCTPKFVDIDPESFNIDTSKIEEAISEKTSAILTTHVFGNPCDISGIDRLAKAHNLKVIYDASHCFGTLYKGESVLNYGDVSTISFHATKVFHTIEGGGVFSRNKELFDRMTYMRNFGHDGPDHFNGVGINAKMSEFHAGMGIVNLKYIDGILDKRKSDCNRYDNWLKNIKCLSHQSINVEGHGNYSYYPILFKDQEQMLAVLSFLNKNEIYPRRYFYPSLHQLEYVKSESLPIVEDITKRILCLPLYFDLSEVEIDLICRHILSVVNE